MVRPQLDEHIHWLKARIDDIDKDLQDLIRSSPLWREREQLLRSVPGVGPTLSANLLARLPELGCMDRGQIAALVVAPLNRDSGAFLTQDMGWADIRSTLYMAALVASRHKPVIREFYQRLCNAGSPKKVALVACMRKLQLIRNSRFKSTTLPA